MDVAQESWLSSKMDEFDLLFEVMGIDFNENLQFLL